MKLARMILVASVWAAATIGRVTAGSDVARPNASCCAWAYSTDWSNCGLRSTPQPSPGYVQLCCTSSGCDRVLSTVMSCTDCGSCGTGSAIETFTVPGTFPAGALVTVSL